MTTQVIKADDVFLLTDERGDIPAGAPGGLGLFTRDTRFLSRFELRLNGSPLLALTAEAERGDTGRVLLVNAPAATGGPQGLARDSVVLERLRIVADGVLYERLTVTNHHRAPQEVEVAYEVDADFADVFLVRGYPARRRGLITARRIDARGLRVRYDGADGIRRETRIRFSEPAATWDQPGRFRFRMALQPGEHRTLTLTVEPVIGADRGDVAGGGRRRGTATGADRTPRPPQGGSRCAPSSRPWRLPRTRTGDGRRRCPASSRPTPSSTASSGGASTISGCSPSTWATARSRWPASHGSRPPSVATA